MKRYRGLGVPVTLVEREVYPTLDDMYEEVYDRRATLRAHALAAVKGKRGNRKPTIVAAPPLEHDQHIDAVLIRILGGIPRARKAAA